MASWRNFFDETRSTSDSNSLHFSYRKLLAPSTDFSQKKMNQAYKDDLSHDTQCFGSDSGWVNGTIFFEWFKFFISIVHPTKVHKVFLILHNHESHRSLDVVEYARNNVKILSVSPPTTHKLQPWDVAVFHSFNLNFEYEIKKMARNGSRSNNNSSSFRGLIFKSFSQK